MKSFKSIIANGMAAPTPYKVLSRQECTCGEMVTVAEFTIVAGPEKGKTTTQRIGCRCWEKEQAKEILKKNEEAKIHRRLEVFDQQSLLPPNLKDCSFENYRPGNRDQRKALNKAMEYAEQFDPTSGKNILFTGTYGVGKSHLALSMVKTVMNKGYFGVFISVPDLFTVMKSLWTDKHEPEADFIKTLKTIDFLVLDDIGAEYTTRPDSWASTKLFEIINSRGGRCTAYTTNLNSENMQARFGNRNFSRICLNNTVIVMTGEDWRRKTVKF